MAEFTPIECTHDGTLMEGMAAAPDGAGPHPCVILFPGATGTGPTFRKRAAELVELGYFVACADMYEKGADLSTPEAAGTQFMALLETPKELRARVVAWFETVAARPEADASRIAALGYCFGGKCVLELARSGAELEAVVSFHGLLTTHDPAAPGTIKPEVVAWCAGQDPYAPMSHVEEFRKEMRAAEVSHQITMFSYAQHSFTDPDHDGLQEGIAYHQLADRVSWAGTVAVLEQLLG
ncbi:MAG: dienelactone hydrolase family protein [Novosphingobium sp.]|nr:dienelactone hydrolase family protein [Novosphingobium sp.]